MTPQNWLTTPLVAAPMAGGTTTTELALAVQNAGAFAFAAGGYKTADALEAHIAPLRATGRDFGVNLFVPRTEQPSPAVRSALAGYCIRLEEAAHRFALPTPLTVPEISAAALSDYWDEKIELLLTNPVPVVSFTFGLAPTPVVGRLQRAGSRVLASVTSVDEALAAAEQGVDGLVLQHSDAGGHTAAFLPTPRQAPPTLPQLVTAVHAAASLPIIAAGGVAGPTQANAALAAGATAVAIGTALIRTDESGARQLHKDALANPAYSETRMTDAFTGRSARALVNDFLRKYHAGAPAAYPEVHFLTTELRAAAAAAGDPEYLNLWAGRNWRAAQSGPAAAVVHEFLQGITEY